MPRAAVRALAIHIAVAVFAVGCSGGSGGSGDGSGSADDATDTTRAEVPDVSGNPGTLVAPTTTTEPPRFLLPVAPTVAFLDACIADAGLVGPCHCAASRLGDSFNSDDLVIFEDRLSGRNEFSPEVAALLVECRDAPVPVGWSSAAVERYVAACTKGAPELDELCRCSVSRATDVIPEVRLDDYLASDEVSPSLVDLVNTCL